MATNVNDLIFIKRIKKKAPAPAHGGAWKIAYADFVTAMMAFFLLMWLLNATSEDQKTAISNYFAPASVSRSNSGAGGVMGGRSIDSEGSMNSGSAQVGLMLGVRTPVWGNADEESEDGEGEFSMSGAVAEHEFEGASGSHMGTLDAHDQKQGTGSHLGNVEKNDLKDAKGEFLARAKKKGGPDDKPGTSNMAGPKKGADGANGVNGADGATRTARTAEERRANDSRYANDARSNSRNFAQREQQRFNRTEKMLKKLFEQDPKLRPYRKNLKIEQIGAGMRIQILDSHKVEMFPLGSAEMESRTNEIMAKIAESIMKLPNKIAIVGHTDATPYAADSGYSNWELSTDRAHASRRALIAAGLPESRVSTVIGKAATEPLNKADPDSPVNRRISILLLREAPPAIQPGRSLSGGRRDPYSGLNRTNPQPRRSPVPASQWDSRATAPGGDSDIDPFEGAVDKEEAAPSAPVEKKVEEIVSAEEPVTTVKEEEPAAEVETPAPEEVVPVEDGEIIDNDLWLCL